MNTVLGLAGLRGLAHCEQQLADGTLTLAGQDYLSGHVTVDRFSDFLGADAPRWRFFSSVREPIGQLASHLNWMFEIWRRGADFLVGHRIDEIKKISAAVYRDFGNEALLIEYLSTYRTEFLNVQSQYLAPTLVAAPSPAAAKEALKRFEFVGRHDQLHRLFARIGLDPATQVRENASEYQFPSEALDTPRVRAFLEKYNKADQILFETVLEIF